MGRVPPGSHGNTCQQTAECVERGNMNKFLPNSSVVRDRDAFHCRYTRVPTSMPGDQSPLPGGGKGLLRGSRTRSYGSLVRSPRSPVRRVEHTIQPGETLQGLALRYGVSMEDIKRANRLYTNDSIFLKKSLSIPVLSDLDGRSNGVDLAEESGGGGGGGGGGGSCASEGEREGGRGGSASSDLTPVDFLKRLDDLISRSKQAAAKGCEGAEKRVAALEAACSSSSSSSSRTPDWRPLTRSQSVIPSFRAARAAPPRALTKLTKNLRDGEDEIFEL